MGDNLDGFELNLATTSASGSVNAALAGTKKRKGRWTDRLKSRNIAKRARRETLLAQPVLRQTDPQTISDVDDLLPTGRAIKAAEASDRHLSTELKDDARSTRSHVPRHQKQRQIISSLFDPHESHATAEKVEATHKPVTTPTNAPLDTSTFSTAGIHQRIIEHIKLVFGAETPTAIQQAAFGPLLAHSPFQSFPVDESDDDLSVNQQLKHRRHLRPVNPESDKRPDILIQSETGSGKTLAYLLPILLHCIHAASQTGVELDRASGTLAIVLVPTRELALQLFDIADALFRTRDGNGNRHHLVPGLLIGGTTRTHEKARLRKGINILIATPGRLLDHLQNTEAFASSTSELAWLVFDEADRLMELGFEETLTNIVKILDSRRRVLVDSFMSGGAGNHVWGGGAPPRRQTILCSATVDEKTTRLAGFVLHDPLLVSASQTSPQSDADVRRVESDGTTSRDNAQSFSPPAQLRQSYVVVPTKLRLVTLIAALKSRLGPVTKDSLKASVPIPHQACQKAMVFVSCTDSVDFHWRLLSRKSDLAQDVDEDKELAGKQALQPVSLPFAYVEDIPLFRLHGSLSPSIRLATFKAFAKAPKGILFCTDVAARGLNLSNFGANTNSFVDLVVQYDPPTDGWREYIHRVGRTARMGKRGEALLFLLQSERDWIDWLGKKLGDGGNALVKGQVSLEGLLKSGFSSVVEKPPETKTRPVNRTMRPFEAEATECQLALERWIILDPANLDLAKQAFTSHIRAYATYASELKEFFHVKNLHLGHLAKSFGLREAPKDVALHRSDPKRIVKGDTERQKVGVSRALDAGAAKRLQNRPKKGSMNPSRTPANMDGVLSAAIRSASRNGQKRPDSSRTDVRDSTRSHTEVRMQDMVRQAGRRTKQSGVHASHGADEFQVGSNGYV